MDLSVHCICSWYVCERSANGLRTKKRAFSIALALTRHKVLVESNPGGKQVMGHSLLMCAASDQRENTLLSNAAVAEGKCYHLL